jgi:hypothetical protein
VITPGVEVNGVPEGKIHDSRDGLLTDLDISV